MNISKTLQAGALTLLLASAPAGAAMHRVHRSDVKVVDVNAHAVPPLPSSRRVVVVKSAQEVVEQALAGGGIVEDIAHERCLSGLLNKITQANRRRAQTFQEERIDRGVARRKLGGIEIPSLVVGVDERVADVIDVQPPGAMDDGAVLRGLLGREV